MVILITACLAGAIAGTVSFLCFRSPAQALRDAVTALCGVTGLLNQVSAASAAPPVREGGERNAGDEDEDGS
ncbi:hypothetical protein [Actinomadura macra]|uniref:hypothetical protein n=1 Tax=Actinomadura macra TaxID=46164 RepID=UPI00082D072B|nr:hypothetical protein [Actinomadura macra]